MFLSERQKKADLRKTRRQPLPPGARAHCPGCHKQLTIIELEADICAGCKLDVSDPVVVAAT